MGLRFRTRAAWLAASAVLMLAPAASGNTHRAALAPPGTLAYLSDRAANRGGELYSVDARGRGRRSLSRAPLVADYGMTPSRDGRKVAFMSNRNGTWAVWVAAARRGKAVRVGRVNGQPLEQTITWDPTGTRLAYDSGIAEGVRFEVWVAAIQGGRPRELGRGAAPDWSPRGDRIAFEQWLGDSDEPRIRIAVVSPRGHRLWTRSGFSPQWSPDGRRVAFLTDRGAVVLATADGRTLRRVGRAIERFAWLPDGRHLVLGGERISIVTAVGRRVFTAPPESEGLLWSRGGRRLAYTTRRGTFVTRLRGRPRRIAPSLGLLYDWSPNGRRIAAVAYGGRRLLAIRTDGGGVRALATEPVGSTIQRAYWHGPSRVVYESHAPFRSDIYLRTGSGVDRRLTTGLARYASPVWATDGTRLAAATTNVTCIRDCFSEIAVVDASSGRAVTVTTRSPDDDRQFAGVPSWSPDGRFIAFDRTGPPGDAVRVVPAEGGAGRELVKDGRSPAWSPDGREIAFIADGVFVVDAAGGTPRRLASGGGEAVTWSPDGRNLAWRDGKTIRLVPADGSAAPAVAVRLAQLACGSRTIDSPAGLAWSRDGTRFVFGGCARAGTALANLDLWSVRTDGTGLTRLTRSLASEWAPTLH